MIRKLVHQIENEFLTAEEYMECAAQLKSDESDIYKSLAKEELNHAERLMHLGQIRLEHDLLDEKCKVIWEYEKERFASRLIKDRAEYSLLS